MKAIILLSILSLAAITILAACIRIAIKKLPKSPFSLCAIATFLSVAIIYGSTKNRPITYLRTDPTQAFLYDNGSYVSNDVVHISFNYMIAPSTADFKLWYWPDGSTNENEMVLAYTNTLGGVPQPYDFYFQGAISNRWYAATTWTPGPSVNTNGILQVHWMTDRKRHINIVPVRTSIIKDGKPLSTLEKELDK